MRAESAYSIFCIVSTLLKNFVLSGWMETRTTAIRMNTEGGSNVSFMCNMLEKLHLCLLYLFGLFVLAFEFGKKTFRSLKPMRVGASLT